MEKKQESIQMREEQLARDKTKADAMTKRMKAENAQRKALQEAQSKQARADEITTLEHYNKLVTEGASRDMILARLKILRDQDEPPPEIKGIGRNEVLEKQFNAEQAAGRAAVARAEAEEDRNRAIRAKIKAEEEKRLGTMDPVHRSESKKDQSPSTWPGRK